MGSDAMLFKAVTSTVDVMKKSTGGEMKVESRESEGERKLGGKTKRLQFKLVVVRHRGAALQE